MLTEILRHIYIFLILQVCLVLKSTTSCKAQSRETLEPLTSAPEQDKWLPSSYSRFTSRMITECRIAAKPHGIKTHLSSKYHYYVAFPLHLFISPVNYAIPLQRYEVLLSALHTNILPKIYTRPRVL